MAYKLIEEFPIGTIFKEKGISSRILSSNENNKVLLVKSVTGNSFYKDEVGTYLNISKSSNLESNINILKEKALLITSIEYGNLNVRQETDYYYDNCTEAGYVFGGCEDSGVTDYVGITGNFNKSSLNINNQYNNANLFFTNNSINAKFKGDSQSFKYNLVLPEDVDYKLLPQNSSTRHTRTVSVCVDQHTVNGRCVTDRDNYYYYSFNSLNVEKVSGATRAVNKDGDDFTGISLVAIPYKEIYADDTTNEIIDYGDVFISNIQARPMKNRPCKITWNYEVQQNPPYTTSLGSFEVYASVNGQPYELIGQPTTNSFELLIDPSWNTIQFKIRGRNNVGYWGTFVESKVITTLDVILNLLKFKEDGIWKTGLLNFVKANGVWHPTSYYKIKKNGKWIERKL